VDRWLSQDRWGARAGPDISNNSMMSRRGPRYNDLFFTFL
jgi:hypothetical protein